MVMFHLVGAQPDKKTKVLCKYSVHAHILREVVVTAATIDPIQGRVVGLCSHLAFG